MTVVCNIRPIHIARTAFPRPVSLVRLPISAPFVEWSGFLPGAGVESVETVESDAAKLLPFALGRSVAVCLAATRRRPKNERSPIDTVFTETK